MFKYTCSDLFAGLPLEAEGGSFSPRLSSAVAIVAPVLQLPCPCPANLQACPTPAQRTCHPVVGKDMSFPALVGCLSKNLDMETACLLLISVWAKPATGMQLSECTSNPPVNTSYF